MQMPDNEDVNVEITEQTPKISNIEGLKILEITFQYIEHGVSRWEAIPATNPVLVNQFQMKRTTPELELPLQISTSLQQEDLPQSIDTAGLQWP
ncbi:hypothetical protein TNCV_817981 [Trichonephila clavipes]|nr:hypothetical protein TNCV_817981 [Trichonephila clavipes]